MIESESHLKRWFKFAKIHKTIPTTSLINDESEISDSISYQLQLHQVLNINNKNQSDLSIRVLFNLFNTQTKEYFGRTYESPFIDLIFEKETDNTYTHEAVTAYFHLQHDENPPVQIIVEIILFEKQEDIIINRYILGWAVIPLQIREKPQVKYNLKKGSSRFLIIQQTNFEISPYTIVMELSEYQDFNLVKHLVDQGCICGIGDSIIGIRGQSLKRLRLSQDQIAYVTQIKMNIPIQVDLIIAEYMKEYKVIKFRDESSSDLQIVARRLVIAFHNGWTFTNSRGLNNFVTLEDAGTIQITINNQKIDHRQLRFKGALDINNVYSEPKFGVFVLQLEYDIQFYVENMGKQRQTLICGWVPIQIQNEIDEELVTGPGNSLGLQKLIDLTELAAPITIKGIISYGGIGMSQGEIESRTYNQLSQAEEQQEKESRRLHQDDKAKLKKLEQQISKLQLEKQQSTTCLAMSFEEKLRQDRKKEQQYHDMVESIQKQHEEEIDHIKTQYEQLKAVLGDIHQSQQQYLVKSQLPAKFRMSSSTIFDQQETEKWKIIESMTSIPRKTFYKTEQQLLVEAKYGNKNLTKKNIEFLSSYGVRGLFYQNVEITDYDDLKLRSLQQELQDSKQGSRISIQFLSFIPLVTQLSENLEPNQNFYSDEGRIPFKSQIGINIFDFPIQYSEPLTYENGQYANTFKQCLQTATPLVFITETYFKTGDCSKEPITVLNIPRIQCQYPGYFEFYCKYLYNKCITFDIWDYESVMLYGTCKIPMRSIMRQGKDTAFIMKSVDIVSPDFKQIKGQLQVILKNEGIQFDLEKQVEVKRNKNKIVSTSKLTIESFSGKKEEQLNLISSNPDERIKERIKKLKPNSISLTQVKQQIQNINTYKDIKKEAFARSVIQDYLSEEQTIYPLFGKLEIVPLQFTNPFQNGQNFVFVLDDQELKCSGIQEVNIVHQPVEWKYFVDTIHFPQPPEYNMIQSNSGSYSMFLNGKETVTILIKYLTLREVDTSYNDIQKTEVLILDKGHNYLKLYSYPRQVALYINTIEGQSVGGLRLKIFPKPNWTDHIYRFYERDNRQVQIVFPVTYGYIVPAPDKRPRLFVSNQQVTIEWANDFEIKMNLKVGDVSKTLDFHILCYQDTYFRELIANWKILVYSLAGLQIEIPLGQSQVNKLTVTIEQSKQARFFSSHPLSLWFPQPYDGVVSLLPQKTNIINFSSRILLEQVYRILVTCVEENSRQVIKSWIIILTPTVPPVSRVFDIDCPKNDSINVVLPYQNKLNSEIWMIFISSNYEILQLSDKRISYKPQQTLDIKLTIYHNGTDKKTEVKLFVGDEDRSRDTYDCLLFRIKYF